MSMQIATSLFYDRTTGAMAALSAKADALQTQISTGKKLAAPSSDSAAYQRLQGLTRDTANDAAYTANLSVASSVLQQADTTLGSVTSQLQRASELVVQARSGTISAEGRKAIGTELGQIVESLAALANTQDLRGQPLFGGVDGGQGAVQQADGSYALASAPVSAIPVGDGMAIQANETASRVFTSGGVDAFKTLAGLATALQSDTAPSDATLAQGETDLSTVSTGVATVRSSLGARAARVDLQTTQLKAVGADRAATVSGIEDTDITATITDLQKTMTILSATQASFTKLAALSLFDYLK